MKEILRLPKYLSEHVAKAHCVMGKTKFHECVDNVKFTAIIVDIFS